MRPLSTTSAKENMVGFLNLVSNLRYHVFNLFKNHQADFAKYEMHRRMLALTTKGQNSAFGIFEDKCHGFVNINSIDDNITRLLNGRPLSDCLSSISLVFDAKKQLIKDEASDKKSFRSALLVGGMDIGCWFLPKFGPVGFALSLGLTTFAAIYSYSQSKDAVASAKTLGVGAICSILGRTLRGKFGFICSTILGVYNAYTIFPGIRENSNIEAEFNPFLDQAIGAATIIQAQVSSEFEREGIVLTHQSLKAIYDKRYEESRQPGSTTSLADSVKKALELKRLKYEEPLKSYVEKLQAEAKNTPQEFHDIIF